MRRPLLIPGYDYALAGRRIKRKREWLRISLVELAERTQISRQTLAKIEEGHPSKRESLMRIRHVLYMSHEDLQGPEPEHDFAVLQQPHDQGWSGAYRKDRYQKHGDFDNFQVNDPVERKRLASLGFQPFFTAMFHSHIPDGIIQSTGAMELYAESWVDSHPGEEAIYCLRGEIKIVVDGHDFDLVEGACLVFDANKPHQYIPTRFPHEGEPVLIFIVLALTPEEGRKSLRTWHPSESTAQEDVDDES